MTLPLLMLAAPILVAAVVYGLFRLSERRASARERRVNNRSLTERGQLQAYTRRYPFHRAFRAATLAHHSQTAALRHAVEECREAEQEAEGRFAKHGAPVLDRHESLIAYIVLISVLTAIGVFMFVANVALDIALIKTLEIADDQATRAGCIAAVLSTLIGLAMMEVVWPSEALQAIKKMKPRKRKTLFAGVAAMFATVLFLLPLLATARAETRLGGRAAQAQAACELVRRDASAASEEAGLACATAQRAKAQLQRAIWWDQLVAVGAPIGEAAGSWAFLRMVELGVAGGLAVSARRARHRRGRAERRVGDAGDAWAAHAEREALDVPDADLGARAPRPPDSAAGPPSGQPSRPPGDPAAAAAEAPASEPSPAGRSRPSNNRWGVV